MAGPGRTLVCGDRDRATPLRGLSAHPSTRPDHQRVPGRAHYGTLDASSEGSQRATAISRSTKGRVFQTAAVLSFSVVIACSNDAERTYYSLPRLEIDHSSGRQIVGRWEHGFPVIADVDHQAGLIYIGQATEPFAAIAYSLEDGSILRVHGGQQHDGSGRPQRIRALAARPSGVALADDVQINYWDSRGLFVRAWRPGVPSIPSVCWWMGEPAVPLPRGVLRRDENGSGTVYGDQGPWEGLQALEEAESSLRHDSHIACIEDVAYVLDELLTGFALDGRTFEIPIPVALEETSVRRRAAPNIVPISDAYANTLSRPYSGLFDDGKGRLVIVLRASEIIGAIVDPQTDCQSILLDTGPRRASRRLVGMYRDSVLVVGSSVVERVQNGERTKVIDPSAYGIALHPLEAVGGTPCPRTQN